MSHAMAVLYGRRVFLSDMKNIITSFILALYIATVPVCFLSVSLPTHTPMAHEGMSMSLSCMGDARTCFNEIAKTLNVHLNMYEVVTSVGVTVLLTLLFVPVLVTILRQFADIFLVRVLTAVDLCRDHIVRYIRYRTTLRFLALLIASPNSRCALAR